MASYEHNRRALELRLDADESAVLARELESIEKIVTETRYPELKALLYVPLIVGVDPGAETYTWRRSDKVGTAKVIANRADDLPRVDISLTENYVPIRGVGNVYDYTVQELRAFKLAKSRGSSISLDQERAKSARLFIERKIDAMVATGEPDIAAITGMINNSSVNIITPVLQVNGVPVVVP